jgi:hypothetical protein
MRLSRPKVQSVVEGDNADLMYEVARLWIRPQDLVLDTTYGRGLFWSRLPWLEVEPYQGDFTRLPFVPESFDVVIYDPPYTSTGGDATSTIDDFNDRYGLGKVKGAGNLFAYNVTGLAECARVSRRLVMVKCADFVESGHKQWGHQATIDAAKALALKRTDEFVLFSGTGPQPKQNLDGTPRRQVHSRRAHSFLCVFSR